MDYTFLMQKQGIGAAVKDSLADFGIVCTEVPFMPFSETKELPSRDWPDEDGEDTYIPAELPAAAYDLELGLCYKGSLSTCHTKIKAFIDYLTGKDGNGSELTIYLPYTGIGRKGCYLKSVGNIEFAKSGTDEVLTFTATFRVTDPVTDVQLTKGN